MKAKTYFSALAATVLIAMGTTPAFGQQSGKIEFVGSIVYQGCGTAQHTYGAYTAREQLNFDLQLNDCVSEVQNVVSMSIDAVDKEGELLDVNINAQSSAVDVVVGPGANASGKRGEQPRISLSGEGKITPLDIKYRDAAGQLGTNTDNVYVIVNLSYA